MINPDEIPLWFGIPAGLLLWAAWILICIADARARRRAIRAEFARATAQPNRSE